MDINKGKQIFTSESLKDAERSEVKESKCVLWRIHLIISFLLQRSTKHFI